MTHPFPTRRSADLAPKQPSPDCVPNSSRVSPCSARRAWVTWMSFGSTTWDAGRSESACAGEAGSLTVPKSLSYMEDKREYREDRKHTSELQSLMRISYAVLCLKKKKKKHIT